MSGPNVRIYDVAHGWANTFVTDDEMALEGCVDWYWGEPDTAAVQVILSGVATGGISPIYAQVTVWLGGLGTPHYVADPASLAAYVAQVLPGVKALAHQEYRVIE